MARRNTRTVYSSQFANEPAIGDYKSFFNPVPIDFIQEQLRGRQAQYDTAFAGALADKDALAQEQVGLADIASKNQIIGDAMNNIDKTVEEQFGGDWGRAAKTVARQVSELRANPFWNAQKEVEKRRQAFGEQVTKFGPRAMIFGQDPRQLTTMDEQGGIRGVDQFTGRVVEQGNWGKTAREIFSSLTDDQLMQYDISPEDFDGFITGKKVNQITRTKIENMAKDPVIQLAFQQSHPEFVEGFNELDETQKEKFGLKGDSLEEVTRQTLLGNIAPSVFRQETKTLDVNPYQLEDFKGRIKAGASRNPYIPVTSELPIIDRGDQTVKDHKKRVDAATYQGKYKDAPLTPNEEADLQKIRDQFGTPDFIDPETGDNVALQTAIDSYMNSRSADKVQGELDAYENEIRGLFPNDPELADMDRQQIFDLYGEYLNNVSQEARNVKNIKLDESPEALKRLVMSNINAQNFTSFAVRSSGDVFDTKNIAKELGYSDYRDLVTAIKDEDIFPRIDYSQGQVVINLPMKEGKNKYKPVDIYMDTDKETQQVLQVGQAITEMIHSPQSYPDGRQNAIPVPDGRGGYTGDLVYVEGNSSIFGNDPFDPESKKVYIVDSNNQSAPPKVLSLNAFHNYLTEQVDTKFNNITGKSGNPGKE